jgi:periplasmic protein TonB
MFETAVLNYGPSGNRVWAACLGMTGQALMVGVAIVIPMIFPEALPMREAISGIFLAPTPPPPPHVEIVSVKIARDFVTQPRLDPNILVEPAKIPAKVDMREDPPAPPDVGETVVGGMGPATATKGFTLVGSILDKVAHTQFVTLPAEHKAPPPAAPVSAAPPRVVVGGLVKAATPIRRVEPIYPAVARAARISGAVKLEGVIGVDGRIKELKVLEGHPFLVKAALEAVREWIYRPTTLNGEPVEVVAPITVTFHLN